MAEAIRNAQRHVHVCSWHLEPDFDPGPRQARPVRDLLAETAERVPVRVLVWAGAPVPVFQPRRGDRQGRARAADQGHQDPVPARRLHPDDALPSREARDRRRRARLRRRHRPHLAGRRPLRLQRAPAQGGRDRLARRLVAAARADRARRRRPLRAALGGDRRAGAGAPRGHRARRRHDRPVHPHGARGRLPRAPARRVLDPRELRPRAAQRPAPDLPREPVPVVAGDRPASSRASCATRRATTSASSSCCRTRPTTARTTRAGCSAASSPPTTAARTSSPPRSCRARGERSGPLYVHAKIGIVDDAWLAIGSANLNEHSLFNDTEVDVVTCDAEPRPRHPPEAVGRAPRAARRRRPGADRRRRCGARSRPSSSSAGAPARRSPTTWSSSPACRAARGA